MTFNMIFPAHASQSGRTRHLAEMVLVFAMLASLTAVLIPAAAAHAAQNYTVNVLTDTGDGAGTTGDLRWAINQVNAGAGGDTITITAAGTINLSASLPTIVKGVAIVGPGADQLTVSGNGVVRVLEVSGLPASAPIVSIDGITIANGFAGSGDPGGGGVRVSDSRAFLTVTNTAFVGNVAVEGGGGAIKNGGTLAVGSSTFTDNSAGGSGQFAGGGAIWTNTPWSAVNSTFTGNMATGPFAYGGAINNCRIAYSLVVNSTITGNSASRGGGVYTSCLDTGILRTVNSIVSGNIDTVPVADPRVERDTPDVDGRIVSVNSLFGVNPAPYPLGSGSGNLIGVDPMLSPLGDHGGPTQTFALLPGSPLIGAGIVVDDETLLPSIGVPTVDQRGLPRAGHTDIGAFQSQGFTITPTSGDNQSVDTNVAFAPLVATVTPVNPGEPVAGGRVDFTAPTTGASITTPTISATITETGQATITPTANAIIGGPYSVTAASGLATPGAFTLTNLRPPRDVAATKTNDVSGALRLGNTFNWTIRVTNIGALPATFPDGATILLDNLPASSDYGPVSTTNLVGVSGPGSIACSITDSNLRCAAAGGDVVLAAAETGTFEVTLAATPRTRGAQPNPRPSGVCKTDPDGITLEPTTALANNNCADTVAAQAPELVMVLRNNVNGQASVGVPWTWELTVANGGDFPATFEDGQRIVAINLPNLGVTYGLPTVIPNDLINPANLACSIAASDLTCAASGGTVTLSRSLFRVQFTAMAVVAGTIVAPRAGGQCLLDPDSLVLEGNESDNSCTDTLTTPQADLDIDVFSAPASPVVVGELNTWVVRVANVGVLPASFGTGQEILYANFPVQGFSGALISNVVDMDKSNLRCRIDAGYDVSCSAAGPLSMPVGSSFEVLLFPPALAVGTYVVPRPGGVCAVDRGMANSDGNLANNTCSATIEIVLASDLKVTKTNDIGRSAVLGDSWTARLAVTNSGPGVATFPSGSQILVDDHPSPAIYGAPEAVDLVAIGGTGTIGCVNDARFLTCRATDGTVALPSGASFAIRYLVTPTQVGTHTSTCYLDPALVIREGGNVANNVCTSTVTVSPNLPGTIRIVHDMVPDGSQDFAFAATGGLTPATVNLDDDGDAALSNSHVFTGVARGSYTVTADPVPGYRLTAIVCTESAVAQSTVDTAARTANIRLDSGEDVVCTFTHEPSVTVTIDRSTSQANPTSDGTINFDVVFSEPVSGFSPADVSVSGTAGATAVAVAGGPTVYTVTVSGMTGDGTVIATVAAGAAADLANTTTNGASTSTDNTVVYDATAPTVTVDRALGQADFTNTAPIAFTVRFSEPVTGFTAADVLLTGSAGPTNAVVTSGGPTTYEIAVSGMTRTGLVTAAIAAGAADDAAGFASLASTPIDDTIYYDTTSPTVTIDQTTGQADPTTTGPIEFAVVFSESVIGFAAADVMLGGTAGATNAAVTGSGNSYVVTVWGMTADGTVVISVPAGAVADSSTNTNLPSASIDDTVTYDTTAPSVTINQATDQADPTNDLSVEFDVVFSEPVTGFSSADITIAGDAGATSSVLAGGPAAYTVSITGMTGDGTIIAVIAAASVTDRAGISNLASTSNDGTVLYDGTVPTVTIEQVSGQVDPTDTSIIMFDIVFSEAVFGFDVGDVTIAGTAGAPFAELSGSDTTYTVRISGFTSDGTVTVNIAAAVAADAAGNANLASTSSDDTVTYDTTAPTVTINRAPSQAAQTNAGSIAFDVVFSEPVTGFDAGDITLGGTAGAALVVVSGGPATYSAMVSGMVRDGTVTVSIADGVAADAAGGPNETSTSTADTVTYDTTPPVITSPRAAVVASNDPGANGAVVTFSVAATDDGPSIGDVPNSVDLAVLASLAVSCAPESGTFFPIGTTAVECEATDVAGNETRALFDVVVVDNEQPAIAQPEDVITQTPNGSSALVNFVVPSAADNSGTAQVACSPSPGSMFALGSTTVTCIATDASGNSAAVTFHVTVTATPSTTTPRASAPSDPTLAPAISSGLPRTGTNVNQTVTPTLVALLLGALLLAVSRSRRRGALPGV